MSLAELSIKEASLKLKEKEISSLELTKAVFEEIKKAEKDIHAFLELSKESAFDDARKIDKKIDEGDNLHPLAGVPVAIKDNILVSDMRCTAGSKILENYTAPYDATVISKLKELGAIIIGKTNLDEFGMGSSTENSAFSPTKNPRDITRVPGGSSGGSAAAVIANECVYALGSDTGGSIRQPAAFCGVVGLKPTYGAVSRYGLMAMSSSLDQIGPLTKTVEDAEIVFRAISGKDKMDSTSVRAILNENQFDEEKFFKNLRIGIPNEYFSEGLDIRIEKIVRDKILEMERMGAKISGVNLPHSKYALACYYVLMPAEVSSNLARYDGVKYGAQSILNNSDEQINELMKIYLGTRGDKFGKEVKRRIILGTFVLSAGYYDSYYNKAQKVRALIKKDFDRAFEKVDVLFTPTTPTLPFKFGEKTANPLEMYLSDIYTASVNLAGLPALSMPCGEANGLPVGLQIIGKSFDEITILNTAKIVEKTVIKIN